MAKSLEKKPKMESMKKFITAYSVLFVYGQRILQVQVIAPLTPILKKARKPTYNYSSLTERMPIFKNKLSKLRTN
jgi:hypothetical protein